ncbi:MAG: TlpA family protein disulfide reductase [Dehalococcoidia bacterium]|nr:TlpA family protein disulfide reductase [Dehalococcoidia bacterium]
MNLDDPSGDVDERPQRRREYSGASSTLGVAALIILTVGVAIWWFQFREDDSSLASDGYGVIALPADLNPTDRPPSSEVGRVAPDFLLASTDGSEERLSAYRGKWVLLNFWASWCGPCRQETPHLQRLQARRPDTLVVLGVNQQESRDTAAEFVEEYQLTYPIALDLSGEVSTAYRVGRGLPVSMLVDPTGVIRELRIGRIDEEDLLALEAGYLE